ncbi:MAG: DeoR/GlpR family DNA-binding transcription regulator [Sphaerochaetaceae bacterium]|nr:DeoR/GlpR family DNA-binding transcription regulator [Sphaerochaetaceae bacterium]MDD3162668.1 DeoR/GlpR family DNA-binding transcription regulator [Sphaerochaetaceae bacterium]MDD4006894.1 DeoR/GlpR family DNA-binding transcription regulator [Sphaerochaetaceae bacterium]
MGNWNTFGRQQEILAALSAKKVLAVSEMARDFNVSEVTIRSDLDTLSKRGQLVRTHGGAVLPEDTANSRFFSSTINENRDIKTALANEAAAMVHDGDTVIIDSGSTMAILASLLHRKKITVLTNSLPAVSELASDEGIELMVIGGSFRRSVLAAVGDFSSEMLRSINADILFMGCTSFDSSRGISCPNLNEKITKRLMIDASRKVCVVADCSKSNRTSLYQVASWKEIDCFITDSISDSDRKKLEASSVKVICT